MSWSHVGGTNNSGTTGTSITIPGPIGPFSPGNTIFIASVFLPTTGGSVSSISNDGTALTWNSLGNVAVSGGHIYMFYAVQVTAQAISPTAHYSGTLSGGNHAIFLIDCFQGYKIGTPLDTDFTTALTNTGSTTTAASTASAAPLVYTVAGGVSGGGTTPGGGFSAGNGNSFGTGGLDAFYETPSSALSSATFTFGGSVGGTMVIALNPSLIAAGAVTTTLKSLAQAAAVTESEPQHIVTTLKAFAQTFNAKEVEPQHIVTTLKPFAQSLNVTNILIANSVTTTLKAFAQALAAKEVEPSQIITTLPAFAQVLNADVEPIAVVTTRALQAITQTMMVNEEFPSVIATTLPSFAQDFEGHVDDPGTDVDAAITTTLRAFGQALSDTEKLSVHISQTLVGFGQAADVIEGDELDPVRITTELHLFTQEIQVLRGEEVLTVTIGTTLQSFAPTGSIKTFIPPLPGAFYGYQS